MATASQADSNITIGGGHPAPVQAPPATAGVQAKSSNSVSGEVDRSKKSTPKKHDSDS